MFIFWGTKGREVPRGVVADECSSCGGVRPFQVIDHYEVGHVYYFIELGEGNLKGTSTKCLNCGCQFHFNRNRYSTLLPVDAIGSYSIEEIVAHTHPGLAGRTPVIAEDLPEEAPDMPPPLRPRVKAPPAAEEPSSRKPVYRCKGCFFVRDTPFKFCPKCGGART